MAKHCGILVYYNNGGEEFFYGGLHADEKLLRIWPAKETHTINIPFSQYQEIYGYRRYK